MNDLKMTRSIKTSVKMSDVAAAARVSRVTVSRVLSNKGCVSPTTRDSVMSAVAHLGYNRNANAGILAGNRSQTIGLVVGNLGNPLAGNIVGEFSRALSYENFQLVIIQFDATEDLEQYLIKFLERRVDAIVLLGIGMQIDFLENFKITCPIVVFDLDNHPPKKLAFDLKEKVLRFVFEG